MHHAIIEILVERVNFLSLAVNTRVEVPFVGIEKEKVFIMLEKIFLVVNVPEDEVVIDFVVIEKIKQRVVDFVEVTLVRGLVVVV